MLVLSLTSDVNAYDEDQRDVRISRGGAGGMDPQSMTRSRPPRTNPIAELLRGIDLDATQISSLQKLSEQFRSELGSQDANRTNREQDLANAISENGLDSALLIERESARCSARSTLHASHLSQIIDILTAEQRLELKSMLEAKAENAGVSFEDLGY